MEKSAFIEAGRIVNTHGVGGEVKIEVWLDSPQFLRRCGRVFLNGTERSILSARDHQGQHRHHRSRSGPEVPFEIVDAGGAPGTVESGGAVQGAVAFPAPYLCVEGHDLGVSVVYFIHISSQPPFVGLRRGPAPAGLILR